MILPVIHLNGTSPDRLIEALADAMYALDKAYEATKQTAPNGRDYYPDPGRLEKAQEQFRRWLQSIDAIKAEMDAVICGIQEQE